MREIPSERYGYLCQRKKSNVKYVTEKVIRIGIIARIAARFFAMTAAEAALQEATTIVRFAGES